MGPLIQKKNFETATAAQPPSTNPFRQEALGRHKALGSGLPLGVLHDTTNLPNKACLPQPSSDVGEEAKRERRKAHILRDHCGSGDVILPLVGLRHLGVRKDPWNNFSGASSICFVTECPILRRKGSG